MDKYTNRSWRDLLPKTRRLFLLYGGWASVVAAVLSLIYGLVARQRANTSSALRTIEYAIVAGWATLPPVFFWLDWVAYGNDPEVRKTAPHGHDLARNIWLGFIIVLAVLYKIKWSAS
jgi:hypothetical protein